MRTARTTLLLLAAGAAAGGAAMAAHRRDAAFLSARPSPSVQCTERMAAVQISASTDVAPTARLNGLGEYLGECEDDAIFVEQMVRELLQHQLSDSARVLLVSAQRRQLFAAAEHDAIDSWIELTESQMAFADGRIPDAERLRERVITRATRLRAAWPEWAQPYLLLTEADRSNVASPGAASADRLAQLREARTAVRTGAFVRTMPDSLYAVFVALLVLLGSAMSLLGLRHWSDRRARTRIAASPISTLTTGEWLGSEVAVAGVLQPVPGSEPTIAPFSKQASLWFKHVVNFSSGAPRRGNTSEDRFLIVDDTGQLTIDPVGFRVFTTHRRVTLGGTLGTKRTKPQSEDRLMVGDTVYVHGLLQPDAARPDVPVLTIDRNELHTITNIPPAVLRRNAGRLLTISLLLCLGCAAIVVWSDSERRRPNVPGLLT